MQSLPSNSLLARKPAKSLCAVFMSAICTQVIAVKANETNEEVVVSASRIPVAANRVGSAVTVISADDIKRSQATTVADLLRTVAGVAVRQSGSKGGLTQVRIRGAESNHTLVIIDGVEMNNPASSSEFDFSLLLSLNVARIEIIRGPQSAIYGSDAIGGVVVITTKSGTTKSETTASIEAGTYSSTKIAAATRGGSKVFKYSFGAVKYKTDGFSTFNENRGFTEDDGHENRTFNLKLNYTPNDISSFSFVLRDTSTESESDSISFGVGPVDSDDESFVDQISGKLAAKFNLLEGRWTHKFSYSVSETNSDFATNGQITFRSRGKKRKIDYQNKLVFESGNSEHIIITALEREKESSFTTSAFSTSNREVTNLGYITEYRHSYNKKLFTSLGFRFDDNDIFKNAKTGRLTLAYVPASRSKLRKYRFHASYGTGVKNPTLFELYGSTTTFTGNPNLTPEKAKGWDAGVEVRLLSYRLKLDFTYFDKDVTDLIAGSGNSAVNLNGESPSSGAEITANWRLSNKARFTASYTYTDAKTASGMQQVRRPRHNLSLGINYNPTRKTNLNLNLVHNADIKDFAFDAFFNQTTVKLEDYTVVNFALKHKLSKNFSIGARVENMFDEQYEEVFRYGTSGRAYFVSINGRF